MCDRVIMVDYITLDKLWIESPTIYFFSSGMDMIRYFFVLTRQQQWISTWGFSSRGLSFPKLWLLSRRKAGDENHHQNTGDHW